MQEKSVQHYRVTLEQAKQDYRDGLLTATGLVYYAIAILRPPGQKLRVRPEFMKDLGIGKRTFYRALSKLRVENQLEWEPVESINVWTTPNKGVVSIADFKQQQEAAAAETHTPLSVCHIDPLQGQIDPLQGQIDPLQGQIDPLQGQIDPLQGQIDPPSGSICPNRGSKPALGKGSRSSPDITDIYQIFLISLSNSERENFLNFSRKEASKLPSIPVLPDKWIEAHHQELYKRFKNTTDGNELVKKAIAIPTLEQTIKLQELKDTGKIKDFYSNSQAGNGTIVVDTGSAVLFWWEFLESAIFEP